MLLHARCWWRSCLIGEMQVTGQGRLCATAACMLRDVLSSQSSLSGRESSSPFANAVCNTGAHEVSFDCLTFSPPLVRLRESELIIESGWEVLEWNRQMPAMLSNLTGRHVR